MAYKLDGKDLKIIDILKQHGDYTTREIAKKTLIPTTTVNNRIRKLKSEGIIKKFTIELDADKTGKGFTAYVLISANLPFLKQKNKTQYDLVKEIRAFDFVESADIVSGGTDIVAVIKVKDVNEFDKALLGRLQNIEGIDKTQSLIVIH